MALLDLGAAHLDGVLARVLQVEDTVGVGQELSGQLLGIHHLHGQGPQLLKGRQSLLGNRGGVYTVWAEPLYPILKI